MTEGREMSEILTKFVSQFLILHLLALSAVQCSIFDDTSISKSDFPNGFFFGTATSAYQVEGAAHEDGRSESNWDVFCKIKGSISDGQNAEKADDHYHRYMEDIEIMHSLGINAYRFSISWSRVLPRGKFGEVNQAAIMFYNNLIDNLLLRGIEPFVTIHHNEFPQELEDRYGAWLSPLMREDYVHFAEICFKNFADRVKYWVTINEPNLSSEMSYERGMYPPSHCTKPFGNCLRGNSDIEPLIAGHNMLLAHARAAKIYREQFNTEKKGMIGIVVHAFMYQPMTDSKDDKDATDRALAFNFAWILDPLVFGDYPTEMKRYLGNQLPRFSSDEMLLLKESIDYIGINHYGTLYAKDCIHSRCSCNHSSCSSGSERPIRGFVSSSGSRDGVLIGEATGMPRFFVVPKGMEGIISYVKHRYHNKPMFVTENGYSSPDGEDDKYQNDVKRISYHKSYLTYLARAIRKGADVRGYFVWSLMDNFEWTSGYTTKFGLYQIDNATLNRIPKLSADWYKDFLGNSSYVGIRLSNATSSTYMGEIKMMCK